ncbi:MAG: LamG-like jellyroll fold domain-containing protein [Planctomycetota bacterium]
MLFHPDFNPTAFAEFSQGPTAVLGFHSALLDLGPAAFYRFSETPGSTSASDLTAQHADATHHGNVTTGSLSSLPLDPDPAVFYPGDNAYTRSPLTPPPTGDFTLVFRFSPRAQTTGPEQVFVSAGTPIGTPLIQAEQYHDNSPGTSSAVWTLVAEGLNGYAMQALPDSGLNIKTNYDTQSPRLDYTTLFTQSGTYYIWVYGRARASQEATSDSVHVGLNQTPNPAGEEISISYSTPQWSNTGFFGDRRYVVVPQAGFHDISVWMREDGFIFDRILLTPDPDYDPSTDPLPADAISRDTTLRPLLAGYANSALDPTEPTLHVSLLHQQDDLRTLRYQLGSQAQHDLTVDLNPQQWYSLALQRDDGVGKLYLDGTLIHSSTAGTLDLSHPIDLGGAPRDDLAGLRYAHASLDELAYFTQALPESTLLQLHRLAAEA